MLVQHYIIGCILICLLIDMCVTESDTRDSSTPISHHKLTDCDSACAYRCSLSSRPNLCKRACRTCCTHCRRVPPGTDGYANQTTCGGALKCP
ncbi:hypothetical protein EUGRSUZ_F01649 [Eucalyptus grandis]|uniref:Uncharacterized protein n=2 Tax=Eucalyptus grandis TaxID=71139 RepID=A0ACC3KEV5_EUCGR|nr:hypothetical protein EUGRSUZ_F01649 [Eucalyptus grandis]